VAKGKDPADIGKEQGSDALRGITDRDPGLSFEREEPAPRPNGRRRKANGEDHAPNLGAEAPKPASERKGKEGNGKPHANDVIRRGAEQWTELGNAHRLIHRHGADIRYVHPLKAWFIWDGIFWRRDDNGEIMRRAEATIEVIFDEAKEIADEAIRQAFRKFALKSQSNAQLRAMVQLAQHNLQVILSPDDIDADPMLLGVLNGTVDLNTGEFREGRREDYVTKQCAVAFDPAAQCPNWSEFQMKIAGGNDALVAYKQRLFGLLLTGKMVEILFILHGAGQNGKSTELETIHGLLGDYAHSADAGVMIRPNDRSNATPEIVALIGKRAVFINETDESDHLNESRVKYLTGNDTMCGRNFSRALSTFSRRTSRYSGQTTSQKFGGPTSGYGGASIMCPTS
jgi:phage/plasmid-associated DNA primase